MQLMDLYLVGVAILKLHLDDQYLRLHHRKLIVR
jgi:hypothetical protein